MVCLDSFQANDKITMWCVKKSNMGPKINSPKKKQLHNLCFLQGSFPIVERLPQKSAIILCDWTYVSISNVLMYRNCLLEIEEFKKQEKELMEHGSMKFPAYALFLLC